MTSIGPAPTSTPTYSIVTTCKGRLDDLKQSLPRFVSQTDAEVIVVDYDCPQGTASFVRAQYPSVQVVEVADRPLFNMSDARIHGVKQATGGLLVFLDADVIVATDFLARLRLPTDLPFYATFPANLSDSIRGSCIVRRRDYLAVGGYDDLLSGYESEDLDLYMRLRLLGARHLTLDPAGLERVIEQTAQERAQFRPSADLKQQFLRGQLYQLAKEQVLRARGVVQIDRAFRELIMAQVDRQVGPLFNGEMPFEVTITLPDPYQRGLLKEWEFSTAVTVRAHKKTIT